MDLIRHLTLLTMQYNFYIRAQHIPGKRNEIADSLSLVFSTMQWFTQLTPHADPNPCSITTFLLTI
jgi:hypothetical protein